MSNNLGTPTCQMYRVLNDELLKACGVSFEKADFSYNFNNQSFPLQLDNVSSGKSIDPKEVWDIGRDGLNFTITLNIEHPEMLKGPEGIVCRGAAMGICIIWQNKKTSQMGYIYPEKPIKESQWNFSYSFGPGELSGNLDLDIVFYIKTAAPVVEDDENELMNEAGVILGHIKHFMVGTDNNFMSIPIQQVKDKDKPIWWVEFYDWDENAEDGGKFSRENFCIFLNHYYKECPVIMMPSKDAADDKVVIKPYHFAISILAQTFCMMYFRLSETQKDAVKHRDDLEPDSICGALHGLLAEEVSSYEEPAELLSEIQWRLQNLLKEDKND